MVNTDLTSILKDLRESNSFIKREVAYPLPELFIESFGEAVRVDADAPIEVGDNGNVYKAYPKILFEKKLYDNEVIDGFYGTVGLLVNYNSNKFTVYSGATAWACLNLSIFGADYVKDYILLDSAQAVPDFLSRAEDNLLQHMEFVKAQKKRLEDRQYSSSQFEHRKGEILSHMDLALLPYLKHAEEQLRTKDSIYYDMPHSDWKLLSAMTDLVKDKGVSARVNKTLQLETLFI